MGGAVVQKVPRAAEFEGISGSSGFAVGRALVLDRGRSGASHRRISEEDVHAEIARFDSAVGQSIRDLRAVTEKLRHGDGVGADATILDAYIQMLGDVTLRQDVVTLVTSELLSADWALESSVEVMCSQLRESEDPYLAERSHDFEFIRDRLLRAMTGQVDGIQFPASGDPVVLVARDLSPAETAALPKERVLGIVTEVGTRTSHTSILARAMEIPAVVGVRGILESVAEGDQVVVDGVSGRVLVDPTSEMLDAFEPRAQRYYAVARGLLARRDHPAVTSCGVAIDLQANIELPSEAEIAQKHGARGIGLYRTEFLYIDRKTPPSEDEQYETFRQVVLEMAPLPVTLRTFDIGGDKFVSAIKMPRDMNPALGLRAVRLGLEQPELFKVQLRAMVRASAHGNVRIMIPMVASLGELRAVRKLLNEAIYEVDRAGHPHADHIPLGCMVEVPSAAIMADEFAREAEFFSIGTNDLVQYCLAVDRTSRELARLASYFDPAVVRLIRGVIVAGNFRRRAVSVCGTMASDPLAAILLVGMGLRNLSMEASAIPEVKATLSRVSVDEAEDAAYQAFSSTTAHELEQILAERFAPLLSDMYSGSDEPAAS